MSLRASIVVPVHEEGDAITAQLDRLLAEVTVDAEILVVFDSEDDSTVAPTRAYAARNDRVVPTLNTYGRGPANAIRFGLDHSRAPVVVVTMADDSDEVAQIDRIVELVEEGAALVSASRYSPGGRREGGPWLPHLLSRLAGWSLHLFARVGTRDATNSFKGYSRRFLDVVQVESKHGFEVGIELVAKARRHRFPVVDIPTTWRDRTEGESNFRLWAWLPSYLRWYLHAFGPARRLEQAPVFVEVTP